LDDSVLFEKPVAYREWKHKENVEKEGRMNRIRIFVVAIGLISVSLAAAPMTDAQAKKGVNRMDTIKLESGAFRDREPIPAKFTCDGADVSPQLAWSDVPAAAKSLALIADDPDAPMGTWVHWVVYDLPPSRDTLEENIPKTDTVPGGGKQGRSDFKRVGYYGPCPPSGTHRYFFKLYALDKMLDLPVGKTKQEVEKAMKGHVVAQGELVGTYTKK
jgi:Raf kinase inhibitor-like YbhB/YbcL family protein